MTSQLERSRQTANIRLPLSEFERAKQRQEEHNARIRARIEQGATRVQQYGGISLLTELGDVIHQAGDVSVRLEVGLASIAVDETVVREGYVATLRWGLEQIKPGVEKSCGVRIALVPGEGEDMLEVQYTQEATSEEARGWKAQAGSRRYVSPDTHNRLSFQEVVEEAMVHSSKLFDHRNESRPNNPFKGSDNSVKSIPVLTYESNS